MISLKTNGQAFDLGNISITFRLRSPLFNEVPSHTFSFELPGTPNNLRLTGHMHRVTNNKAILADIPITANIHGWIFAATLRVQSANKKAIKCFMAIDNAQLNVDWGDKMLQEVGFDTIPWYPGNYLNEVNKDLDSDQAVCQFPPCYITNFFDGKEYYFHEIINLYTAEDGSYDINVADNITGDARHVTACVPMFYLRHIIDWICTKNNVNYSKDFFTNADFKELIIFNNTPIDEKRRKYYFRASKTSLQQLFTGIGKCTFEDATTPPNNNDQGVYSTTTSEYNVTQLGLHEFLVSIYVSYASGGNNELKIGDGTYQLVVGDNFIKHTQLFFDYQINTKVWVEVSSFDWVGEDKQYRQIFIAANSYYTARNVSFSNLADLYTDITIKPGNHLPNIKIKEFLKGLSTAFGAYFIFNTATRNLEITLFKDIIQKPATKTIANLMDGAELDPKSSNGLALSFDITNDDAPLIVDISDYEYIGDYNSVSELPFPDVNKKLAYVKGSGSFHLYVWNVDLQKYEWIRYADYLCNLNTGKAEIEIKVPWHPPASHLDHGNLGYIPNIGCKGNTQFFEVGQNQTPFILMHYYGLQPAFRSIYSTPFASGTVYNNKGEQIGTLHLGFERSDGLYAKYLKPIEEFYSQAVLLTARKQTDSQFLRQIDWAEKYLVQGREFLLDTVEFTATAQGFGTAELTAYRCP